MISSSSKRHNQKELFLIVCTHAQPPVNAIQTRKMDAVARIVPLVTACSGR